MSHEPTRPAPASRQGPASPPRRTGTVPRGDPRRKTPAPSPRSSWIFGLLGLVIGAFVIGGIVVGGSSAHVSTATGTATLLPSPASRATATSAPASATEPGVAPSLTFGSISTPEPSAAPTLEPTAPATREPIPTATPTPTPEPTPEPTPAPTPQLGLAFDFPHDGDVLNDADINVIGRAPPGSTVTRDIPMWFDDHTVTRDDGIWMMPLHLGDGTNVLRYRLGDDRSTEQVITVTYQP